MKKFNYSTRDTGTTFTTSTSLKTGEAGQFEYFIYDTANRAYFLHNKTEGNFRVNFEDFKEGLVETVK